MSNNKTALTGWIGTIANLIAGPFENAFPALAGIAGTIVSSFAKAEAAAILKLKSAFVADLAAGKSWGETYTDMLNKLQTEEYAVVTDVGHAFLNMFAHKAKA